ncbi:MAG: hypothetical protein Q3974_01840 [Rothia sp. (in: high G+C Gram-positive bacteria)]|nr:hypothetical protein [Rothia sp. (in: high G+C Gram-positive bacteria)]
MHHSLTDISWALILLGAFALMVGTMILISLWKQWQITRRAPPMNLGQLEIFILEFFHLRPDSVGHRLLIFIPPILAILGGVVFMVRGLTG